MFNLLSQEKIILLFLALSFAVGLTVNACQKNAPAPQLNIQPYELKAEEAVEQYSAVNINSLETAQLTRLPGVGEKLAAAIIEYHKSHGAFVVKEDLLNVPGIGSKKFEKMKDVITLK